MDNAMIVRAIWAALIAVAVSVVAGPFFIQMLRRLKIGQNVYELAPEEHQKKQGTPTMAGLLFAAISVIVAFILRRGPFSLATDLLLIVSVFALLNLVIGFLDDYTKLRGKNNQGLSERQKLVGQCLLALLFSLYCYFHPQIGSTIIVPFIGREWNLGWLYIPIMTFVIICTTNGSNLLDGLDGLLGSVSAVIMAFFAVVLLAVLPQDANLTNVGVLCAAMVGALLGYLRFNVHPARMMMGDTGSMFLGGLVVAVAMVSRLPLLIPIAAGAYAASLLSVFLQRWYFRLTGGKRIFRMSPLHHHFELGGTPETKIVALYTIVTVVLCLVALLGVL